jgi:hypothetical protein
MKQLFVIGPLVLGLACGGTESNAPAAGNADGGAATNHLPVPIDAGPDADLLTTTCGARQEDFDTHGGVHMTGDLHYPDPPPVAGNHNPSWAKWGVHNEAVPDECFVHNLEHGGVVFLYNCPKGCANEVKQMTAFVAANHLTVLTTYPLLTKKFAIVAWGHRIVSECFDMAAFKTFYDSYVNMAPEQLDVNPTKECKATSPTDH